MDCRICTLLTGKAVGHDEERMHVDAPAIPIAKIITAHLKAAA